MKTRCEFGALYWGCEEERLYTMTRWHQSNSIRSASESLGRFPGVGASGRRDADAEAAGGAKIRRESELMDSPPSPGITGFFIPSF
jgi:hypothetical protein